MHYNTIPNRQEQHQQRFVTYIGFEKLSCNDFNEFYELLSSIVSRIQMKIFHGLWTLHIPQFQTPNIDFDNGVML